MPPELARALERKRRKPPVNAVLRDKITFTAPLSQRPRKHESKFTNRGLRRRAGIAASGHLVVLLRCTIIAMRMNDMVAIA